MVLIKKHKKQSWLEKLLKKPAELDPSPEILDDDLTCFKVLRVQHNSRLHLDFITVPPTQEIFYTCRSNITNEGLEFVYAEDFIELDKGVFAAFTNLTRARKELELGKDLKIARCIIPRGTSVWFGMIDMVASRTIIFNSWL